MKVKDKTFNRSAYEMTWISITVIFFGAIVYPIAFQVAKEKSLRDTILPIDLTQAVPVDSHNPTSTAAAARPLASAAHSIFKRDLKQGDVGPDVKELQKYLNQRGFVVSSSGNGSPGHENEVFGPGTKAALKRFQETYAPILLTPYGLTEGTGFFGKVTRDFVNS